MSDWVLLELRLARWQCPVASSKAMDLLHQAMRLVSYHRITMVIEMASKGWYFALLFC